MKNVDDLKTKHFPMFVKLLLICLSIALSRKREWLSFMCTCMGSVFVDLGSCISYLSYDVASGSEITPCNKICKPLVVYRFSRNVMTSITTLRTY